MALGFSGSAESLLQNTRSQEQMSIVVEYYHSTLKDNPKALAFLQKRGINSPEAVSTFKIGFSDRTLGLKIPDSQRKAGREIRTKLQETGLIKETGVETFRGCLTFPIFDENGNILQIYGRKVNYPKKGSVHVYLPGPKKGIWNTDVLKASEELIVCNSVMDALSFWCIGFRNVIASFESLHDLAEALRRYEVKKVFMACECLEKGDTEASALPEALSCMGADVYRISFPKSMHPNDFIRRSPKPYRQVLELMREAVFVSGKHISQALSQTETPPIKQLPEYVPEREKEQPGSVQSNALRTIDKPENAPDKNCASSVSGEEKQADPDEQVFHFDNRRWRIKGLARNNSHQAIRVNIMVSIQKDGDPNLFHIDTLDLYSARHRKAFIKQTAEELHVKEDIIKKDLGKVLLHLEKIQDELIRNTLEPKKEKEIKLSADERREALNLLKDERLLDKIVHDFDQCGLVGEETNKILAYLSAVSRKLDEPLAVLVQSSSAAGKTTLMEAVLSFVPPEDKVEFSAMTGQSLFYMGETNLKHKVLAIAEEEGAERAIYALKLLQSESRLTIASTGKESSTGRLVSQSYRVEGPVSIFLSSTAIDINEELLNRCIILTVDEDRIQTRRIHEIQRENQTLEGLLNKKKKTKIIQKHQNAQRMLRPLLVVNPYARELRFMDNRIRTRRDHTKYLSLIRTITLLHQYQRPLKYVEYEGNNVPYIETELKDIKLANKLAAQVLGRCLDELAPQTRRLLLLLDEMVSKISTYMHMDRQDIHFSRKQIMEYTGFSYDQASVHLNRLVDLEYLFVLQGTRGRTFVYELLYEGQGLNGQPFMMGLIDVDTLKHTPMPETSGGSEQEFRGGSGPHLASIRPLSESTETVEKPHKTNKLEEQFRSSAQNEPKGEENKNPAIDTGGARCHGNGP